MASGAALAGGRRHDVSLSTERAPRLHPRDVDAIARALAPLLVAAQSPWMTAGEAAEYLRCPKSRIRKLTMTGELPCEHDGRRVLYNRGQLDEYVRRGGARCP
jgi:excisionase family DNA binding protein